MTPEEIKFQDRRADIKRVWGDLQDCVTLIANAWWAETVEGQQRLLAILIDALEGLIPRLRKFL